MIINLTIIGDVAVAITQAFRSLFGLLCIPIYNLIEIFYDLFSYIARADVLSNDFVNEIYRKVGFLLGIFMTFKLIFSLIQALIDPSKLKDKKSGYGSIVMRCLVSIVLLGITPSIFSAAFDIQNTIIGNNSDSSNIIYRLIVEDNSSFSSDSFGRKLATELFFSFYRENEGARWDEGTYFTSTGLESNSYETLKKKTEAGEITYSELIDGLYDQSGGKYLIDFDGFMCFVVGFITAYLLLTFCIQTAVRVFQLAYLQLIAPIPIISYISDPEGSFKKWTNQCISTYLDLFIRLAIIYFILYLSNNIMQNFGLNSIDNSTGNTFLDIAIEIFLIFGLFLFAKKVPDLIKDLFPNLGGGAGKFNFGLNPKKDFVEPFKSFTKPIGWLGNKAVAAVDRKIYNLPKPRNKIQQYFDKLTPGRADIVKKRNQAVVDMRKIQDSWDEGKKMQDKLGDYELSAKPDKFNPALFRKMGFHDEWVNAFRNESIASDNLSVLQKRMEVARAAGDSAAVEALYDEIDTAQKIHAQAQKELDYASGKYEHDAIMMSNYKLYTKNKNRRPGQPVQEIVDDVPVSSGVSSPVSSGISSSVNNVDNISIEMPDIIPNTTSRFEEARKQQAHESVQQEMTSANAEVNDRINNTTNLSDAQKATAETLQNRLQELISYKEQVRDNKDKALLERDIQKVKDELDKLLK